MKKKIIETQGARLYLEEDGICRSIVKQGAEFTIDEIKEDIAALSKITAGKRTPVLNDLRGIKSITHEAREYLSGSEVAAKVSASALLIGSKVSKVIGNIFLGFSRPYYPTKLFTSEENALAWLKGFVQEED